MFATAPAAAASVAIVAGFIMGPDDAAPVAPLVMITGGASIDPATAAGTANVGFAALLIVGAPEKRPRAIAIGVSSAAVIRAAAAATVAAASAATAVADAACAGPKVICSQVHSV